jgi:hypothetical protein
MALLPLASRLSLNALVLWPLLANVAAMAAAIALAAATSTSGAAVIGITLPTIGLTGATSACLQAGTFALASHFAPHHIQVVYPHRTSTNMGIMGFAHTLACTRYYRISPACCDFACEVISAGVLDLNQRCGHSDCRLSWRGRRSRAWASRWHRLPQPGHLRRLLGPSHRSTSRARRRCSQTTHVCTCISVNSTSDWPCTTLCRLQFEHHRIVPTMQAYFLVSLLATAAAAAAYCAMWALPYVRARCKPDGAGCQHDHLLAHGPICMEQFNEATICSTMEPKRSCESRKRML